MSLADVSVNTHLRSMQSHVNIVHFLNLVKNVSLERWIQLFIGGFKTVSLAWVNKFATGYTWLFVYESAHGYEEGIYVPLG